MKKLLGFFVLTSLIIVQNAAAQGIVGDWKGMLNVQTMELRVGMSISGSDSGFKGKMDILDQGMKGFPVSKLSYVDSVLSFSLNGALYEGRMQADGKIDGTLVQQGVKMEMDLERGAWVVNRPQQPKAPFPYKSEDVSYPNAAAPGVTLAATLTIPDQATPYPAVILISGSGANDRNEDIMMHQPFAVIADYLSRHGVAVLRFDDRGVKGSTGNHAMATSADFATDALAGLLYLKGRNDLKISKIGMLGHSEGGVIAPMAAIQSADVAFIVMLAGTGVRGDKLLTEQTELVLRSNGTPEDEIKKGRASNEKLYEIIVKSKSSKQARKKLESSMRQSVEKGDSAMSDAQMKAIISQINNVWFRYFLKHDPAPVLEQVHCPVLAINGDKDIQVSATQNLPTIEAALKKAGNPDVTIRLFPGLNHLFQHCEACTVAEYGKIEETIAPEVLEAVGSWILEKGK